MSAKLSNLTIVAFLVLFQPMPAVAQQAGLGDSPWTWAGHWHLWGEGWGPWGILLLLVLLAVAACVVVYLDAVAGAKDRPQSGAALQILNERFAKGEIQRHEFEERRTALLTVLLPPGQNG